MDEAEARAALAETAAGDAAALERLYRAYGGLVLAYAQRLLGDPAVAEEVLQDAFLRIWRAAGSFSPDRAHPLGWILAIGRNVTIDRLRRERRYREQIEIKADEEYDTPPIMHANPIHADLAEALAALPAAARACLHDAYWEGLTQREIARRQRRPLGTVKSDIRRTLMALRAAMRRES